MRIRTFIGVGLLVIAQTVCADEILPVVKAGNEVYSNVTVTMVTSTDVFFTYSGGLANVKLKDLDPELQKHFHDSAAKAEAMEKKQADANAKYHAYLVVHPTQPPPDETRSAPPPAAAPGPEVLWRADLPGALSQARSEDKLVLLDFTGSDWCPWCIRFDHEVLSTDQFAVYAKARLVLVKLDFPRHTEQDAALKQANQELCQKFNVDEFPTYILLSPSGKELGRQVGYAEGGPSAFIAELDGFSKR